MDQACWTDEQYWVDISEGKGSEGRGASATIHWSQPWIRKALESWDDIDTHPEMAGRLSQYLLEFLGPTRWAAVEAKIAQALSNSRPIHLTIRADNADELYHLPWELLKLNSGHRLVSLDEYLLRYECPRETFPSRRHSPQGRILVAYSCAGGWVPAQEHIDAIRDACQRANLPFDPTEDVLTDVTRKKLTAKLNETIRPVTVLHLLCHGAKIDKHAYGLTFSSEESASEKTFVSADELQDLLFQSMHGHPLRLVILCSCQGGDAGTPAYLLGGLGRMFHQRGVPAVLASRLPLTCDGSVVLTKTLYEWLLVRGDNLRTAITETRRTIQEDVRSRDWLSIQLYAHSDDESALMPFSEPPPSTSGTSERRLILIRHEAYTKVSVDPHPEDAPSVFADRQPQVLAIDQTPQLEQRDWTQLAEEVKRLASPNGELRRAYAEQDADIAYYGFPYVPLAFLAGHLTKTRRVYVFEYLDGRFKWESGTEPPSPPLKVDVGHGESGTAARLRISVSAPVHLKDCQQVLPDSEVKLDLHFSSDDPTRGRVRQEAQLKAYLQQIQDAINQYITSASDRSVTSVHIFAAVPVSMAFHLGHALAATWLPECFVYNYGREEQPTYKWRLSLQAAARGKNSIKVFKQARRS